MPESLNAAERQREEDEWLSLAGDCVGDVVAVAGLDVLDRWRVHGGFDYSEGESGNLGGLKRSTELLPIRAELLKAVGFQG